MCAAARTHHCFFTAQLSQLTLFMTLKHSSPATFRLHLLLLHAVIVTHLHMQPSLADDWISFTSRPWVQGPIDNFFDNQYLAAMMADSPKLQETVDSIIATGDAALQEV
jgi:hypothetical protein